MNKDLIDAITTFEKMYRDFKKCKAELDNKKDLLDYLNFLNENSLSDFDRTHKDEYIFAQIGEKPVEPLIFGKDKWIVRVARWEDSRRKAEKSYYEYFSKERENLQMEKVYERRSYAMQDYYRLSNEYEQKKSVVDNSAVEIGILENDFGKLAELKKRLEEGRADTLKEARTIFKQDLFQQKIEKAIEDINCRIKEMNESIEKLDNRTDSFEEDIGDIENRLSDLESDYYNSDDDDEEN